MLFKRKKIGLALGGGGVRALASIGVIRRLIRNEVKISCISGTSMGAVVGGLFAYYRDIEKVEKRIKGVIKTSQYRDLKEEFMEKLGAMSRKHKIRSGFRGSVRKYFSQVSFMNRFLNDISLIGEESLRPVMELLIPDVRIEQLPVRFSCVCVDITFGRKKVITEGRLFDAVMGTIAVPGVLPPFSYGAGLLSDGGGASMTPVEETADLGADFIIAVEVAGRLRPVRKFRNGMEIVERSTRITADILHLRQLERADLVISPRVKSIFWGNFDKADYCIAAGESAAIDIGKLI